MGIRKKSRHEKTSCLPKEIITTHDELLLSDLQNERNVKKESDVYIDEKVYDSDIPLHTRANMSSGEIIDSSVSIPEDVINTYMNTKQIKNESSELDGTFNSAHDFFTKHGPWTSPDGTNKEMFGSIAKLILEFISRHDQYSLFAKAVTEDEAP